MVRVRVRFFKQAVSGRDEARLDLRIEAPALSVECCATPQSGPRGDGSRQAADFQKRGKADCVCSPSVHGPVITTWKNRAFFPLMKSGYGTVTACINPLSAIIVGVSALPTHETKSALNSTV